MIIREAQSPDEWNQALSLLQSIYVREGFTDPDRAEGLFARSHIDGQGNLFVAIGPDGTVMGAVVLVHSDGQLRQIAAAGEVEFRLLGVADIVRNKGIGRALVSECMDRARRSGAKSVVLSTQPTMLAAHRLYESLGFRRQADRDWRRTSGRPMWVYSADI